MKFAARKLVGSGNQHYVAHAGHHGHGFHVQPVAIAHDAQDRVLHAVGPVHVQAGLADLLLQRGDLGFRCFCFTNDDHFLSP